MNRTSLSALYRRLTANGAAIPLDAEDLVAAADGALSAERRERIAQVLATSPAQAGVVKMLRALKAESLALAGDVARTQRETAHRSHQRVDRRVAAGRRFGGAARWAAAMAACLVAVIGVWTQRHMQSTQPGVSVSAHSIARSDVIFTSRDTIFDASMDKRKPHRDGDRLFHTNFNDG